VKHFIRVLAVLGISGLLGATGTLAGQSRAELRRKYGVPISETFIVRPGITATATYGTGGRIIEWLISPQITDLEKSRGKTLNGDAVKAILDELVPASLRGKPLTSSIRNVTCLPANDCGGSDQVYQNVTIYYNSGGKAGLSYVVLQWNVGTGRGH
jgi:hypothetical protein